MTEDKAGKALRKVIINLIPTDLSGGPHLEKDELKIDISDKLKDGVYYSLCDIKVDSHNYNNTIVYRPFDDFKQFKAAVENILDATIVNAKQRESVQKLLNEAFWAHSKSEAFF